MALVYIFLTLFLLTDRIFNGLANDDVQGQKPNVRKIVAERAVGDDDDDDDSRQFLLLHFCFVPIPFLFHV